MTHSLSLKRAIVTGGTRGIGRAITESLLEAGCSVLFCGRNAQAVQSTVDELKSKGGTKVFGQSADVSSLSDVEKLFEYGDRAMGGLDILVNNAGIGIFAKMAECSVDDWRRVIDVNLSGAFYCSRQAVPRMIQAGGGHVVHIGSLAGKNPFATGAAYNASKFALNGFAEAMMLDHRNDNIRVTTIMPGSVDTEFSHSGTRNGSNWKIASQDVADMVIAVLKMPERTMVSSVEMRPSKPQKG
jgi:3-oxoacyl-[acyl-carrier protein] reductase